jgi:large repetitive protein
MKHYKHWLAALALVGVTTGAHAIPFHYLAGAGSADPTAPITAAGHTPMALTDLTAADLAGVEVLWVTNASNSAPPSAVTNNLGAIGDWVRTGGVLSYHDRYVGGGAFDMANVLPGAAGVTFVRNFDNDDDIDILSAGHPVVDGPAGTLDDTSLDGGSSSSHGYADATTLPAGAVAILNRGGAPGEIVDFYYSFGLGWVYYSTIPLDFYLAGAGTDPPRGNFTNIYAVNEAAFQASLAGAQVPVPEPATAALLGLGLLLAGSQLRRRRSA